MFRTLLTCSLSKKNSCSTSVFDVVNLFGPFGDVLLCGGGFMVPTMRVAGICCRLNARPNQADDNQWNQRNLVTTRNPPPLWFRLWRNANTSGLALVSPGRSTPWWAPLVIRPEAVHHDFVVWVFWYQKDIHVFLFQVWKIPVLKVKTFFTTNWGRCLFHQRIWDLSKIARESVCFLEFSSSGGFGIEIPSI